MIDENITIKAILLHRDKSNWRKPVLKYILKQIYYVKCWFYKCEALRTIKSEEGLARRNGIPIIWTNSIKSDSFFAELKKTDPDIIVLGGGWHELIPKRVFDFPPLGCINTHPSLLPEFRGTSITRWQVLYGIEKSGSTIHYVDDTFDTGGVLAQKSFIPHAQMPPQELFFRLGELGADIMVPLIKRFEKEGKQKTYKVEHNPKYYKYFKRWDWNIDNLIIQWNKPFRDIHFKILANTQESFEYKGTYFHYKNKRYFVRKTTLSELDNEQQKAIEEFPDNSIYVYGTKGDKVHLLKKGEPYCLILERLQIFDNYYKFRRSHNANKLLNLKSNTIFI
jgi:methionyl-tRNA formyltransferase